MNVTQWFFVGIDNPLATRPGYYEVQFTWPGQPVMRLRWDGKKWLRIGAFKPNAAWGDKWRGLLEAPA
jgi:hypothetical protein